MDSKAGCPENCTIETRRIQTTQYCDVCGYISEKCSCVRPPLTDYIRTNWSSRFVNWPESIQCPPFPPRDTKITNEFRFCGRFCHTIVPWNTVCAKCAWKSV